MGVLGKLSPFSGAVAVSRRADACFPAQITLLIALSMALLCASLGQAGDLDVLAGAAAQGTSYGLRVTPGSTCAAANDLVITSAAISGTYEACNSIIAGVDTTNGVEITGDTTFIAGDEIVLRNKFTVGAGDSFVAQIGSATITPQWAYVQDNSPTAEKTYNASFHLRLTSLSFGNTDDRLHHFVGYANDGTPWFRIVLRKNGTEKRLYLEARKNDGSWESTENGTEVLLGDPYNKIEINWKAGSGTGYFQVALNDGSFGGPTDIGNSNAQIDYVKWGAVDTDPGAGIEQIGGYLDVDEFSSWR